MDKWYILGGISLLLLQGILIFTLLKNRAKHKQAEAKLQENQNILSQERLRIKVLTAGVELSSNLVVVLQPNGLLLWVNKAFTTLSGYIPEEILGKDVKQLLSEQNDPQRIRQATAYLRKRRGWRGGIIIRRKDGYAVGDVVSITPIVNDNQKVAYFLVVGHNSEKAKAQEAMAAAKDAESQAEKAVSTGTTPARIVHDLNQPLNSIKMISGGVLYLLNQGKKLPDEELTDCMKEISCQTDRIAGIIKSLKVYSG